MNLIGSRRPPHGRVSTGQPRAPARRSLAPILAAARSPGHRARVVPDPAEARFHACRGILGADGELRSTSASPSPTATGPSPAGAPAMRPRVRPRVGGAEAPAGRRFGLPPAGTRRRGRRHRGQDTAGNHLQRDHTAGSPAAWAAPSPPPAGRWAQLGNWSGVPQQTFGDLLQRRGAAGQRRGARALLASPRRHPRSSRCPLSSCSGQATSSHSGYASITIQAAPGPAARRTEAFG